MFLSKNQTSKAIAFATLLVLLTGCGNLPNQGIQRNDVENGEPSGVSGNYLVIDMEQMSAPRNQQRFAPNQWPLFPKKATERFGLIGPGDVLNVTIWEAGSSGLFSSGAGSSSGSSATMGQVNGIEIDPDGFLYFPYLGRFYASGVSTGDLSTILAKMLAEKTKDPQVQVERIKNASNRVSVLSGVKNPGVYELGSNEEDVLDVLAKAGGSMFPSYESLVRVTRDETSKAVYLDHLIQSPDSNFCVLASDEISIERKPKNFTVLGAVRRSGQYNFGHSSISILEGLAKARGLNDDLADPEGVFIFRFEDRRYLISQQLIEGELPKAPIAMPLDSTGTDSLAPTPISEPQPATQSYTVQADNTIYSIARILKIDRAELIAKNNLAPPYTIFPGQVLVLPTQKPSRSLGQPPLQRYAQTQRPDLPQPTPEDLVPVIYRFDFRRPEQIFAATKMNIQDKDVLYVSNASSIQLSKFLKILGQGFGIGVASSRSNLSFNE